MKYMGSKRYMLQNGLAELIRAQAPHYKRIVDPFCGSGAVAWFAAENTDRIVIAADLQKYAAILARSVINRTRSLNEGVLIKSWILKTEIEVKQNELWKKAYSLEKNAETTESLVKRARILCKQKSKVGPVWNAYGGHYYSPTQALKIDYLIKNLPKHEPARAICHSSLIAAASKCAASPGHTAQPFQPTKTAKSFIASSWRMEPISISRKILIELNKRYAKKKGRALVSDALKLISSLKASDLLIIDPPYSGVQYSRFYHVLETIAQGHCGPVSGKGRYPSLAERPQSEFSNKGQAQNALEQLFKSISKTRASVIFTFPVKECSNGLSGKLIQDLARKWFTIEEKRVHGHFSTMGGNNVKRAYRQKSEELLLFLKPLKNSRG